MNASFYRITLKEVKAFLPKINCKISTSKLRDIFQEVDTGKRGEISFDDFSILYQKLIFDENVSTLLPTEIETKTEWRWVGSGNRFQGGNAQYAVITKLN